MIIYKKYFFDAAHYMPNFKKTHKYAKVHGHSYEMIIKISGDPDKKNNWIINYDEIDNIIVPIVNKLDHRTLNEISGLENPTAENIAKWFWKQIKKKSTIYRALKSIDQELVDVFMKVIKFFNLT